MHIVSYFFTDYVFVLPPDEKLEISVYFPCSHLPLSTLYHIAACHIMNILWTNWLMSYIFMLKSFFPPLFLEINFTCQDIHIYIYNEYISIIFFLPYLVQWF